MGHTYLGILWKEHKKLFVLACLFIFGAFLPFITGFEITPFYAWRMYAWPMTARVQYDTYVLHYNGKEYNRPHTFDDYNRMMIMYTMPHYDAIRQSGDTLPFNTKTSYLLLAAFQWNKGDNRLHMTNADLEQYPAWLKRYTARQVNEPVTHIEVSRVSLVYKPDHHVQPVKKEIIVAE